MKCLTIAVGLAFLLVLPMFAGEHSALARVTVYWHGKGSGANAAWNGARLREGHCAVDPKKISYGSKVVFPDAECVAVDSGPAVVNRKAARSWFSLWHSSARAREGKVGAKGQSPRRTIDLRNLSAHARAKGRSLKIESFIIVAGIFGLRQEVAKLCRLTAIQTRPPFVIDPDHACPNKRACSDVVCLLVT
jgi:hypothetical protein